MAPPKHILAAALEGVARHVLSLVKTRVCGKANRRSQRSGDKARRIKQLAQLLPNLVPPQSRSITSKPTPSGLWREREAARRLLTVWRPAPGWRQERMVDSSSDLSTEWVAPGLEAERKWLFVRLVAAMSSRSDVQALAPSLSASECGRDFATAPLVLLPLW